MRIDIKALINPLVVMPVSKRYVGKHRTPTPRPVPPVHTDRRADYGLSA
jgi:hypothetical protein